VIVGCQAAPPLRPTRGSVRDGCGAYPLVWPLTGAGHGNTASIDAEGLSCQGGTQRWDMGRARGQSEQIRRQVIDGDARSKYSLNLLLEAKAGKPVTAYHSSPQSRSGIAAIGSGPGTHAIQICAGMNVTYGVGGMKSRAQPSAT
jgi:hypothetical protein